jgi:hypothetical protein
MLSRYILVYNGIYSDVLYFCVQDTIVVVPPNPYSIEGDHCDVPLEECLNARSQLCHLLLKDGRLPKNRNVKNGPDDLLCHLVFFNAF